MTLCISRRVVAPPAKRLRSRNRELLWAQVGLLMLQLQPGSLLLVSVFGLVDGGAQVLAGGAIGTYLDRCASSTDLGVEVPAVW